jgi:DNA invertase Pin-like site-specific DNA recombinase
MSYHTNLGLSDKQPVKYEAYYRVSTSRQGDSGLGLSAQKKDVENHIKYSNGEMIGEYVEVESGRRVKRPQLEAALAMCKKQNSVLIIAKLDRLARNVAFVSNLMVSGVQFVAVDNPHATKLTIHILSAVAEFEAELISQRTKASLARSTKELGKHGKVLAKQRKREAKEFAMGVFDQIKEIQNEGITTYSGIAKRLNELEVDAPNGGAWYPTSVKRTIQRV